MASGWCTFWANYFAAIKVNASASLSPLSNITQRACACSCCRAAPCSAPLAKRSRRRPCCTFCSSAFFITWPLPKERRRATSATSSRRSTPTTTQPRRWVPELFPFSQGKNREQKMAGVENLLVAFADHSTGAEFFLELRWNLFRRERASTVEVDFVYGQKTFFQSFLPIMCL